MYTMTYGDGPLISAGATPRLCQVFEEIKTGVRGLSLTDLPYALRCLGIDLSDYQVEALLPNLYSKPNSGSLCLSCMNLTWPFFMSGYGHQIAGMTNTRRIKMVKMCRL